MKNLLQKIEEALETPELPGEDEWVSGNVIPVSWIIDHVDGHLTTAERELIRARVLKVAVRDPSPSGDALRSTKRIDLEYCIYRADNSLKNVIRVFANFPDRLDRVAVRVFGGDVQGQPDEVEMSHFRTQVRRYNKLVDMYNEIAEPRLKKPNYEIPG